MARTNSQGKRSGFSRGELNQTSKHEQTRGACYPKANFNFKSSEMAINASKPANSNINL